MAKTVGEIMNREVFALRPDEGSLVADRMTTSIEVVSPSTPIDEAGRRMARLRAHRLIVTEGSRAVGVVSAFDIMSALLGMPVVHPADEGERRRLLDQLKESTKRWPASAFHCETEHGVAQPLTHTDP
jgi:signal-transduction protein with cAMP-binding, CBS, and nucleotidyltransferase domain